MKDIAFRAGNLCLFYFAIRRYFLTTEEKINRLCEALRGMGSVAVAFSVASTAPFSPPPPKGSGRQGNTRHRPFRDLIGEELADAATIAAALDIGHVWLDSGELADPAFTANAPDRCYHCKKSRFAALVTWAKAHGYNWVVEGTNADDTGDYRPGMKAVAELPSVKSPLLEAGIGKDEIRAVSRRWGLPTWDKPSAACLVSRLAYGLPVTVEKLRQVEEAERAVRRLVPGQVRVRHHGDLARIEVLPADIPALAAPQTAAALVTALRAVGFTYVALDLSGYRTGSMNETLKEV
jgi:uncharacterized protein